MTSMQGYDKLVGRGEASGSGGPGAHRERGVFPIHSAQERPAPAVRAAGACTATGPQNRPVSRRAGAAAPSGRTAGIAAPSGRTGAAGRCVRGPAPARSRHLKACGYVDRAALRSGPAGRSAGPDAPPQGPDDAPAPPHRSEEPGHPTADPGHAEDDGESDHHEHTGPPAGPALGAGGAARACRELLLLVPRGAALPCSGRRPPRASHQSPHRAVRTR